MKTLTVLRHAKSSWDEPALRDFDRALNARGIKGAKLIGDYMKRERLEYDHVVSSPAVRCTETLELLWEGYGKHLHPVWDRRIYLASCVTLLDVVKEAPAAASHAMMCGHNPGLEDLILLLTPDESEPMRDQIEEKFPTCALAELVFEVDDWRHIKRNSGRIVRLMRPRDLDAELGPEED